MGDQISDNCVFNSICPYPTRVNKYKFHLSAPLLTSHRLRLSSQERGLALEESYNSIQETQSFMNKATVVTQLYNVFQKCYGLEFKLQHCKDFVYEDQGYDTSPVM